MASSKKEFTKEPISPQKEKRKKVALKKEKGFVAPSFDEAAAFFKEQSPNERLACGCP